MDISLYISSYNSEKTIASVIEAVLLQTYPIKEVLVIDDSSTDKSQLIIDTYPVKLLVNSRKKGVAYTRNKAFSYLNTSFVASLEPDCIPKHDWLNKLVRCFERNSLSGIAGVGGRLIERGEQGIADKWREVVLKQHWGENICVPPFLFGNNTLFEKSALHDVDFYDKKCVSSVLDLDLCGKLKKRGRGFVYDPEAIVLRSKVDTLSSVLKTYWNFQYSKEKESEKYKNLEDLKEHIFYNLSCSLDLINNIILNKLDKKLLYPSLLSFLSQSFLDLKTFINIHTKKNLYNEMVFNLKLRYSEIFDISLEWLKEEFYLESWVIKKVRSDLKHIWPDDPGIAGKYEDSHFIKNRDANKFIEFFYSRISRYFSSLPKVVFEDAWKMIEVECLR